MENGAFMVVCDYMAVFLFWDTKYYFDGRIIRHYFILHTVFYLLETSATKYSEKKDVIFLCFILKSKMSSKMTI